MIGLHQQRGGCYGKEHVSSSDPPMSLGKTKRSAHTSGSSGKGPFPIMKKKEVYVLFTCAVRNAKKLVITHSQLTLNIVKVVTVRGLFEDRSDTRKTSRPH